ncbi:MAG: hypothetical protein Q9160_000787 [Pyrenula sp. 1 TL-2023]
MLILASVIAAMVETGIAGFTIADLQERGVRRYKRNVANTVLTVFFTILAVVVLYGTHWYAARNSWTLELSSEALVRLFSDQRECVNNTPCG